MDRELSFGNITIQAVIVEASLLFFLHSRMSSFPSDLDGLRLHIADLESRLNFQDEEISFLKADSEKMFKVTQFMFRVMVHHGLVVSSNDVRTDGDDVESSYGTGSQTVSTEGDRNVLSPLVNVPLDTIQDLVLVGDGSCPVVVEKPVRGSLGSGQDSDGMYALFFKNFFIFHREH
jgi:hypothetical protein